MTVGFQTFGCKLNQCETESLAESFRGAGFTAVPAGRPAGLHVVNTCTVTSKSEQKARRYLRGLLQACPGAPIIVTGCYATLESEELLRISPAIRVIPLDAEARITELPALLAANGLNSGADPVRLLAVLDGWLAELEPLQAETDRFRLQPMSQTFHSRAYLKIQDGCDCQCSYCRVRLARGHSQSLAMRTIIERVRSLEQAGYREVVLTGVNISSYRDGTGGLAGLLEKLLDMTTTVRFRLSSLEPDGIDADLLRAVAAERICPHFHIPVQSGSARLLAAMGRRPEPEKILRTVHLLASARRDPYLAADFITGFPGENEADFQASFDLATRAGFTDLHVFPFSPRPGTEAAVFMPRIPQRIARERADLLRSLAERRLAEYRLRQPGRLGQVLIESVDGDGGRGTSENYLDVWIRGTDPLAIGSLVNVRMIAVEKNSLIGELVKIG